MAAKKQQPAEKPPKSAMADLLSTIFDFQHIHSQIILLMLTVF